MFDWKGKKLLVLGATGFLAEVVQVAKQYGAYTIAVDYNETAPAKEVADEALLCDVMDVDTIVGYIKENHIDGVITGFTDSLLAPYREICRQTSLPCYLDEEAYRFTTDKGYFKSLCRQFDIPVINEYDQSEEITSFPVIVKPVDNSGARGIAVCRTPEEYAAGVEYALSWSKSKRLLIEDYIEDQEATVFYVFKDGESYLSTMADRHVAPVKDGFIKLPTGYTFPSVGLNKFSSHLDDKFKTLFQHLGIRDGVMFIQGFINSNQEFTPYECGYRLTGSLEYHILKKLCGYDPMAMCINHALTGSMGHTEIEKKINPALPCKAYNISCLMKPGKIASIQGVNALRKLPNVIYCFLSYREGDELPGSAWGKLAQIFLRVLMFAENEYQFNKTMEVLGNVCVLDEGGNELLINKCIIKPEEESE